MKTKRERKPKSDPSTQASEPKAVAAPPAAAAEPVDVSKLPVFYVPDADLMDGMVPVWPRPEM